jgi:hypothetical protein
MGFVLLRLLPTKPAICPRVGVHNCRMTKPFWGCVCSGDKPGDYICGRCEDHCECPPAPDHEGAIRSPGGVPDEERHPYTRNLTHGGTLHAKNVGFLLR